MDTRKEIRILLADDDVELATMLQEYLEGEGFFVDAVHDGDAALDAYRARDYGLVILDVMMPGRNGFEVLKEIRRVSSLPVLMLTARGGDVDSVVGLELGADDYIPKPCNPRVLVARIRAILRRAPKQGQVDAGDGVGVLRVGDLTVNEGAHRVERDGRRIELTSTEYSVLFCLLKQAGQAVEKDALSRASLGRRLSRYDRSLDMHISNLRRKLGDLSSGEARIQTIRGVGYLYTLEAG